MTGSQPAGPGSWDAFWWDVRPYGGPVAAADDARVPAELLALVGWAALFVVLVLAAILIGRFTARFFLRATGTRAERR